MELTRRNFLRSAGAATLLLSLDPPPWFVRHARAVAEVAGSQASVSATSMTRFNIRLIRWVPIVFLSMSNMVWFA